MSNRTYLYFVATKADSFGPRVVLWDVAGPSGQQEVSEAPLSAGQDPEALAKVSLRLSGLKGALEFVDDCSTDPRLADWRSQEQHTATSADIAHVGGMCADCPASTVCGIRQAIERSGTRIEVSVCQTKSELLQKSSSR